MKFASQIPVLLLIAAVVFTAQAEEVLFGNNHSSPAPPMENTAACHGLATPHSPLPHSPRPVSYQCCLTGHGVAVVRAAHSPQPSLDSTRLPAQIEPALMLSRDSGLEVSMVPSTDSPGLTPLRI